MPLYSCKPWPTIARTPTPKPPPGRLTVGNQVMLSAAVTAGTPFPTGNHPVSPAGNPLPIGTTHFIPCRSGLWTKRS